MKYSCPSAYSFGRSKKCEMEKTDPLFNPGPGEYTASFYLKSREPSWKIGTQSRGKEHLNDTPGPGQYDISSLKRKAPQYSMGSKSMVDPAKSSCSPGPGRYNPSSSYKKAPQYSMRSKINMNNREVRPGPGSYQVESGKSNQPAYRFGTEKKCKNDLEKTSEIPGPGNYDLQDNKMMSQTQPMFSFGKQSKGHTTKSQTPGPGQYNSKEYFGKEAPKISIRKRIEVKDSKNIPGPGKYYNENNTHLSKSASYKIGTAKRSVLEITDDTPGPGQYAAENYTNKLKPKSPSCIIGRSKRMGLSSSALTIPGVGNYNIGKELGSNAPKYSMKSKLNSNDDNGVPGPGQYDNNNLSKSTGFFIAKESRTHTILDENPGPGMYDHKSQLNGPKYGFGSEKKYNSRISTLPGPSDYHIPCLIANVNDYTRDSGNFDPNYRYI